MKRDSLFESFARSRVQCDSAQTAQALRTIDFRQCKVFDFGLVLDQMFESDMDTFLAAGEEGMARHREGSLRLPFQDCVFCWSEHPEDDPSVTQSLIVFLHQKDGYIQALVAVRYGGARTWKLLAISAKIYPRGVPGTCDVMMYHPEDALGVLSKGREEERDGVYDIMAHVGGNCIAIAMLLARRGNVIEEQRTTLAQTHLRRARGFRPIPPVHHVLHLSKDYAVRAATGPQAASGMVRCPHDRRSHDRTLASGRVISVRSSRIHGGASGFRVYDVVGTRYVTGTPEVISEPAGLPHQGQS